MHWFRFDCCLKLYYDFNFCWRNFYTYAPSKIYYKRNCFGLSIWLRYFFIRMRLCCLFPWFNGLYVWCQRSTVSGYWVNIDRHFKRNQMNKNEQWKWLCVTWISRQHLELVSFWNTNKLNQAHPWARADKISFPFRWAKSLKLSFVFFFSFMCVFFFFLIWLFISSTTKNRLKYPP